MHQQKGVTVAHRLAAVLALSVGIAGCVDVQGPAPKSLAADQVLSQLVIGTDAVVMAVDDTLQLEVHGVAVDNSAIPIDAAEIQWQSADSAQVTVDANGWIVGKTATFFPVGVIAKYTYEGTTKSDTIPVVVTSTRASAPSARLTVLDSVNVGASPVFGGPRIRVDLYDNGALAVEGIQIPIATPAGVSALYSPYGGPSGEPVYAVYNYFNRLGRFWAKISATVYGTPVRDSVEFTGLYPASLPLTILVANADGTPFPSEYQPSDPITYVQPCALIQIWVSLPNPVDVVFDDSTASPAGCAPIPDDLLAQMGYTSDQSYVGGNVLNLPWGARILRRSNTVGLVTFFVRDAVTKARLPISARFKAIAVE